MAGIIDGRFAAVRVESLSLSWEPPKAEEIWTRDDWPKMQNLKIEKTR
jgi:hypothetical protein